MYSIETIESIYEKNKKFLKLGIDIIILKTKKKPHDYSQLIKQCIEEASKDLPIGDVEEQPIERPSVNQYERNL